ncbi:hypothetical protein CRG98_004520 [Punica granatum]|uniref:Uncharacterized protein n=1 Tax=Punica granatum TaxID=22663 RepID=A0A2I0L4H9_PUNGR|nr:hypothetical protein CRG98_004520 [Punica granatum]
MHNTVLKAAIIIASRELNTVVMNRGSALKEWALDELERSIALSLPLAKIHKFPEVLGSPELKIFILYSRRDTPDLPAEEFVRPFTDETPFTTWRDIEVSDSEMLQEIVLDEGAAEDDDDDKKATTDATKKVVQLPSSLRQLKLHKLYVITSLFNKVNMALLLDHVGG